MNHLRHGRLVYPRSFAQTIPVPHSWDERPLPNLLRGQHSHPAQEIQRIERWYKELRGRKRGLRGRLQSLKFREFWAGLYELMTSRIFVEHGWSSRYEPRFGAKTPDFYVRCPEGFRFIAEVLTAFQDPQEEKEEAAIYMVASHLNRVSHPLEVILEEVTLPKQTVSLKPVLIRVRSWLNQCEPGSSHQITLSLPEVPITLKLSTFENPRPAPGPIIRAVMGLGGKIVSTERIQKAIQKKVDKYKNVQALGLPLVLFVWQGDWLKVTATSLEWALFGRLQAHISRGASPRTVSWSHAPGGLFTWGRNGLPRNTGLSAVVYCSRIPHRGRVYARIQVYHHPYAAHPFPLALFKGVPQCVPFNITANEFSCRWDRRHRSHRILLH